MVTRAEINQIIAWCEQVKTEKKVVYTVERNPFGDRISWMGMFPLIEIDRPREVANKRNLVYDSTMKKLWKYMGFDWVEVIPDVQESVRK
jgi:hypothetical protein